MIDTCSRRSMGCVYWMWQLVFADIVNNNKLSILYCVIVFTYTGIDTWYMHAMVDTWLNPLFYYRLSSLLFIYFLHVITFIMNLLVYIILHYITFPHFTHSLGVFWLLWICICRSDYLFDDQVFRRIALVMKSSEFSYSIVPPRYLFFLFSILIDFLIYCILDLAYILLDHL